MKRRRIRRYRNARKNSGVKFLGFIGIMIVAVICGYLTARFVIAPLLGYDTEVLKLDFPSKLMSMIEEGASEEQENDSNRDDDDESSTDSKTSKEAAGEKGYALQFGLFSTEDRAEKLIAKLKLDGIDAEIKEIDGQYKVISSIFSTKDEAVEELKEVKTNAVTDVFITVIN